VTALICLGINDGRISFTGIGNIVVGKQTTNQSDDDDTPLFKPTASPTMKIVQNKNDDDDGGGEAGVTVPTTPHDSDEEQTDPVGDQDDSNAGSNPSQETEDSTKKNDKSDNKDEQGGNNEEQPKEKEDSKNTSTNEAKTEKETQDNNKKSNFKYPEEKYTTDILPWSKGILTEEEKDAMIEKWGKWHFWDGEPETRPTEDYMAPFPNRDCPYDEFPETAWQADAVYVNHMLDSAGELVARAKEAIYTEYGYGPRDELDHDQLKTRMDMFKLSLIDLDDDSAVPTSTSLTQGGWTTKRSLKGLVRRLLHAMMTNDTFTIVLGGHSAAAGHGNHFLQSYMMQLYKVLEPVFTRVGVKLIVRNLAQGGLGTMQHSLGSSSIYGDNIDVLVWDSSMTEKDKNAIDLFYRQALIGGKRAPVLWGGPFELLRDLYRFADADVMVPGNGMYGIPETMDVDHAATLPFASRYLKCPDESRDLCNLNENRFRALCWIDRDDVTPSQKQLEKPPSQVGWHPGFRVHQLTGRTMAMVMLTALGDAIDTWSEGTIFEGHPLADDHWHVTDYYSNIREKTMNLDSSIGSCSQNSKFFPERICKVPMQGRTEFTPRANPNYTSLQIIVKASQDGFLPQIKIVMEYEGPDVPNPLLIPPDGELDVPPIISNRRTLLDVDIDNAPMPSNHSNLRRRRRLDRIKPGKGWEIDALPGYCDGTAHGICGRAVGSNCLLSGHMDHRGGILGNALSGWLVMEVPKVSNGIIIIKFENWHLENESTVTKGWTEVNGGEYDRALANVPPLPDDFVFEYAIDGNITSLNKTQFEEAMKNPQRTILTLVVLDDPNMKEPKDIEVAFRMRNSGRTNVFSFTHIYWS